VSEKVERYKRIEKALTTDAADTRPTLKTLIVPEAWRLTKNNIGGEEMCAHVARVLWGPSAKIYPVQDVVQNDILYRKVIRAARLKCKGKHFEVADKDNLIIRSGPTSGFCRKFLRVVQVEEDK